MSSLRFHTSCLTTYSCLGLEIPSPKSQLSQYQPYLNNHQSPLASSSFHNSIPTPTKIPTNRLQLFLLSLSAFSLIVTTRQYVGNPIDCVHTKDIPSDVLNTYCWIHSTYTIPSAFWKRIGIDVAHPGIDKTIDPEERRYVKYYQWVCFCLFFQVSGMIFVLIQGVPN